MLDDLREGARPAGDNGQRIAHRLQGDQAKAFQLLRRNHEKYDRVVAVLAVIKKFIVTEGKRHMTDFEARREAEEALA